MSRDAQTRLLLAAATAGLASSPAVAADAPAALQWLQELSFVSVIGSTLGLVSLLLVIGFLMGLAAAEFGRVAWKTGQGVWKATVDFSSTAAQYGAIAAVLACVLYFA